MKNKLISLLSIPLFAVGLGSCGEGYDDVHKTGEYNGYKVHARTITERPYINIKEREEIYGPELFAKSIDDSKRFDEIHLYSVPEGHDLENYTHLDSLKNAYNYVMEHGEVIE